MNENSRELAAQTLNVYAGLTNEIYADARAQLTGALSVAATTLEELQRLNEAGQENRNLITQFTTTLPTVDKKSGDPSWRVAAQDAYEAKAIETSTVWLPFSYNDGQGRVERAAIPHYLIGRREQPGSKGKRAELLLQPLHVNDSSPGVPRVASDLRSEVLRADEAANLETMLLDEQVRDYTVDDIKQLFDARVNGLAVSRNALHNVELVYSNRLSIFKGRGADDIQRYGAVALSWGTRFYGQGISDADLATFGTFDYLNRLAVLFHKETELNNLLQPQPASPGLPDER